MLSTLLFMGLSLDNLVAGFGLGLRPGELPPLLLSTTVAGFSITYTWIGLHLGDKIAARWQNYAEAGAGVLLCLLAALSWFEVL